MATIDEAKNILTDYLTQNGLSRTPARYKLLEYIYTHDNPINANVLYQDTKKVYKMSLATVYNTLNILVASSLIVKYRLANNTIYYEKNKHSQFHHIIVCTNCGKMRTFSDVRLSNTIHTRTFKGFKAERHTLTIYGICNQCSKRLRKLENTK